MHIKKKDLSVHILNKYARAISHDFSEDIEEINQFLTGEPDSAYSTEPVTLQEAIKQRNEWKEKYYAVMEKYLKCIENKKEQT